MRYLEDNTSGWKKRMGKKIGEFIVSELVVQRAYGRIFSEQLSMYSNF